MDSTAYIAISRQSGLLWEMQNIANNLANMSTNGYRRQGIVFSEMVRDLPEGSIAQTSANIRYTDVAQGSLKQTNAPLDLAIEGEGFFMVATPAGNRLTRAGAFAVSPFGDLVTKDGHPVLDAGGAPVFIPPDSGAVKISGDGTVAAGDRAIGRIGLFAVTDPGALMREDGVRFQSEFEPLPAENATILQGFLEQANVDPVIEIARMIEVQRAYESGQRLLDRNDNRVRSVIKTLGAN